MIDFEDKLNHEKFRRSMPTVCMDGNAVSVSGYPDAPHLSINIEGDPVIWLDVDQVSELCLCLHTVKRALERHAQKQINE